MVKTKRVNKCTKKRQKRNKTSRHKRGGDYNMKIVGKRNGALVFDKDIPIISYYPGGHVYPSETINNE